MTTLSFPTKVHMYLKIRSRHYKKDNSQYYIEVFNEGPQSNFCRFLKIFFSNQTIYKMIVLMVILVISADMSGKNILFFQFEIVLLTLFFICFDLVTNSIIQKRKMDLFTYYLPNPCSRDFVSVPFLLPLFFKTLIVILIQPLRVESCAIQFQNETVLALNKKLKVNWKFQLFIQCQNKHFWSESQLHMIQP